MYTWFRYFRIDNLEGWFYYCGYAWLWFMLVQLLHLIPEKWLTFSQHAAEWIFGVDVKLWKHYVALFVLVPNLKEDQSAVFLLVHQVLVVVSTVHRQERNQISNHRKENRAWHSRKFFPVLPFYSHQSLLRKLEINHQLLRPHFLSKMTYLADHRPEKISDEYKEPLLWFFLFCDSMISSANPVLIWWITNLFVFTPNLPHSSFCFRLKQPKLVKKWYSFM